MFYGKNELKCFAILCSRESLDNNIQSKAQLKVPSDVRTFVCNYTHILSFYPFRMLANLLNSSKQGPHMYARPCMSCFVLVQWLASLCQRLLYPTWLQTGK